MQLELELIGGSITPLPEVYEAFDCFGDVPREAREYVVQLSRNGEVKALRVVASTVFVARIRAQWLSVDGSPAGLWSVGSVGRVQ